MAGILGKRNRMSTIRPMGLKLPSTSRQDPCGRHTCGTLPFSLDMPTLPAQHLAGTTWSVSTPQQTAEVTVCPRDSFLPCPDVLTASHCCIWCIPSVGAQGSHGHGKPSSSLFTRMQVPGLALAGCIWLSGSSQVMIRTWQAADHACGHAVRDRDRGVRSLPQA